MMYYHLCFARETPALSSIVSMQNDTVNAIIHFWCRHLCGEWFFFFFYRFEIHYEITQRPGRLEGGFDADALSHDRDVLYTYITQNSDNPVQRNQILWLLLLLLLCFALTRIRINRGRGDAVRQCRRVYSMYIKQTVRGLRYYNDFLPSPLPSRLS